MHLSVQDHIRFERQCNARPGLPTFLGISPPRTGTTWLHQVLSQHPQISMITPKECSFFGKQILHKDLDWYRGGFGNGSAQLRPIRGDISPWYARLSERSIRAARALLPDAKLILVLRNPIDRSWSQALMELGYLRNVPLDELRETALLLHFERLRVTRYSDYPTILRRWSRVFGPDALHVALYDDLVARPGEFLEGVLRHIGADPNWRPDVQWLSKRVYATQTMTGGDSCRMSGFLRWYLAVRWIDSVRELNTLLCGRVQPWLDEMEGIAASATPPRWRIRQHIHRTVLRWPRDLGYLGYDAAREVALAYRNQVVLRSVSTGS